MISLSQILNQKQTTSTFFFACQCTPLENSSKIPENQTYTTTTKLSSSTFGDKDLVNLIRSSASKSPDHDNISIRM